METATEVSESGATEVNTEEVEKQRKMCKIYPYHSTNNENLGHQIDFLRKVSLVGKLEIGLSPNCFNAKTQNDLLIFLTF